MSSAVTTTTPPRPAKDGTRRGRPRGTGRFNGEHCRQLFAALREGATLRKACEQSDLPSLGLVLAWATGENEPPIADFPDQFARATRIGWEAMSYEILDEAESAKGKDMPMVVATKNKIDVVKWLLARRVPDQFGDRLQIAQTGGAAQIHIYLPGKANPGDTARVIDGQASEVSSSDDS